MAYRDDSWRNQEKTNEWRSSRGGNGGRERNSSSWSNRSSSRPQRSFLNPLNPTTESVEFSKNFYVPCANTKKMTADEIRFFRDQSGMNVKGNNIPAPVRDFNELGFPSAILDLFKTRNYSKPTPIQAQGWPMALSGCDMIGIAQTGSGKTLSFAIPGLIHAKNQSPLRKDDGPIVLILAPTRELCTQICEEIGTMARIMGLDAHAIYGGAPPHPQKELLAKGVPVLVATPGRLIDLHEQGFAPLGRVSYLVLDEADRMLDMGFKPQLEKIIPKTNPKRQTLMWSATWPDEVRDLARDYTNNAIQVNIGSENLTANILINQKVYVIEERDKDDKLIKVLKEHSGRIIVFCNMKRKCDYIEQMLSRDYKCAAIHGDKSQAAREKVIDDFKRGYRNILIATDVAARGLDVKDVKLVINYDFPNTCDDYVHRVGRTARGDTKEGYAITFFTSRDGSNAKGLVKLIEDANQKVPDELKQIARNSGMKRGNSKFSFRRF